MTIWRADSSQAPMSLNKRGMKSGCIPLSDLLWVAQEVSPGQMDWLSKVNRRTVSYLAVSLSFPIIAAHQIR
jgi:hypothetical protein